MSRKNRSVPYIPQSPYGKSLNTSVRIDKSSIIWRDFLNGVKRRKRLLNHIRTVALDENDLNVTLKRLLLEIRQLTLKVIEDALEIEYRSQFGDVKAPPVRAGVAMQLPPITSFRGLEGKEDLYMLSDIISDTDDLYSLPNIQAFLPLDFPSKRNPFMLGQDIDGIATLEGPRPEPGNAAMELKALEFLRFKRAAKALLRAEVQVMNKMPLMLEDIEHIWKFLPTNRHISTLIRTVITLLHPDNVLGTERSPELRYLIDEAIYMDPAEFLRQLNGFKHEEASYHLELLAAIRHVLKDCSTAGFTDIATSFLMEWVRLIIGSDCFQSEKMNGQGQEEDHISSVSKADKTKKSESFESNGDSLNKDLQKSESTSSPADDSIKKSKTATAASRDKTSDESLKKLMSKTVGKKLKRSKHEDAQMSGVSVDAMNSLKYEVIKMQQELLKRKILDPKAYGIIPSKAYGSESAIMGKAASKESKLETVSAEEPNEMTPFNGDRSSFNALLLLKELMLLHFSSTGSVEILVNTNKTTLFTQYKREITPEGNDLDTPLLGPSPVPPPGQGTQSSQGTQLIHFNPLNKLMFDRLTGLQIDSLFEMSDKIRKNNLAPFLTLVQSHLDRYADPHLLNQQIHFTCDLCVVRDVLLTGNISVDVEVVRSESSNGLIIRATPKQGALLTSQKMELTPITLFIHDKELLVLLINQRGLYTLALNKWSCLEMVARWLLSRIHINRIPIPIYSSSKATVNFDDTGHLILPSSSSSSSPSSAPSSSETAAIGHSANHSSDGVKTYFEVEIDRSVEIDPEIKQYWFAHNLPVLNGVSLRYDLTARQELEMLYIQIHLTLTFLHPSIIARRKKEKEEAKLKSSTLYQFTSQYDDEYHADQVIPNTWDIPFDQDPEVESHSLQFVFGLTGVELLMFGTGETLDEKQSSSGPSNGHKGGKGGGGGGGGGGGTGGSYHSSQFMKSIMSRLHLNYLGNKSQPLPSNDELSCIREENWEMKYSRRLLRSIRTISGGTMVVTVSGIGNELLYEVKPTDNVLFGNDIGSKLFSLTELIEIVQSEGWAMELLEPVSRVTLAHKIMEKLKVILDHDKHRIEFYTFPETRLLEIIIQATINKPEMSIGLVEINSLLTLSDLRIVINHELDRDLIPKLYRFIYKSSGCALKQEPFRKAWECLPKCYLTAKTMKEVSRAHDTTSAAATAAEKSQEAIERAMQKARKMEEEAQRKNKLAKKLVPVPIPTLCVAQEGVWAIYTRHDMSTLLQPGDVLRIGHIDSSDFIVPMSFQRILDYSKSMAAAATADNGSGSGSSSEVPKPIKMIPMDQYFLTFGESNLFISGNTPFSDLPPPAVVEEVEPEVYLDENGKAVIVEVPKIDPESLIPPKFRYECDNELKEKEAAGAEAGGVGMTSSTSEIEKDIRVTSTLDSPSKKPVASASASTSVPLMKQDSPGSLEQIKSTHPSSSLKAVSRDVVNQIVNPSDLSASSVLDKTRDREPGKIFRDLWLWKCIPRSEDRRPKWRQLYDNGEVIYEFTYQHLPRSQDPILFHVPVPLGLIEYLCRDYRCEDMTIYAQRVHEMPKIPLDLYTDLTYTHLVNQIPVTVTQGIDEVRFISLIRELGIFPDLHKPARISQLTLAFFREVNGAFGDETYVNYYGFCALLQEVSLIRYPAGIFDFEEFIQNEDYFLGEGPPKPPPPPPAAATPSARTGAVSGNGLSPTASVNPPGFTNAAGANPNPSPSPVTVTVAGGGAGGGGAGGGASVPPLSLNVELGSSLETGRGSLIDASKWQSQNTRRSSIAMVIPPKKPKGKKKIIQSKKQKLEGLDSPLVTQVDPRHASLAYRKFISDYLILIPEVSKAIWAQAKDTTMEIEIIRYAAVTRILTFWRMRRIRLRYLLYQRAMIILQSYARMRSAQRRVSHLMSLLAEDWLFRLRYHSAILIQSSIRRYLCRCWMIHTINEIRQRDIIVTKARRQRLSKLRIKEKKTIVFKQIRRINGILVLLILRRKDQRNYSNDYGMRLEVYNPQFQLINVFIIEETDLRRFMQDILHVSSLSIGDLLNKNYIEKVISVRLLCRLSKRVGDPPKFILSRQALGQKGPKILTKGRCIGGELFVCILYETGYDIVVQCYHQYTSMIFTCTILLSILIQWVTDVHRTSCRTETEKQSPPLLLRAENKLKLHHWLIDQIVIDKRYGKFNVMFAVQYKKSVKMESILRIQSALRRAQVRSRIPALLDHYILKINNTIPLPHINQQEEEIVCYYLNVNTGESSWTKPSLLRSHQDLPTQPYYRWVPLPYAFDEHQQPTLYVNPFTGKYTHLTPHQAAKKIQSLIRNWMLRPFRLTKEEFAKGRVYELESQASYEREPKRLAFVLNYALVKFCLSLDFREAKSLILEALALAESNPTTTRLLAIYLLATCEAPLAVSREHAESLLRDAWRRDGEGAKFLTARTLFFKYACYRQPRHPHTLLNLGLVEYYIFKNLSNAELCLRRALAMAPFDEFVMENWKKLRDIFPDSKRVYRPRGRLDKMSAEALGGGKKTTIHGRPVIENLAWAGWVFVETDPMFKDGPGGEGGGEYWYNPATEQSQKHMPEDWQKEWELRAWRSVYEGERDGLEYYFDPITATYFQRHVLTNTYQ